MDFCGATVGTVATAGKKHGVEAHVYMGLHGSAHGSGASTDLRQRIVVVVGRHVEAGTPYRKPVRQPVGMRAGTIASRRSYRIAPGNSLVADVSPRTM